MSSKKRFFKGSITGIILGAASSVALVVTAGSVSIPTTFSANTTAKASEVNANFAAVKTAVDDNDGRITANTSGIGALNTANATNTNNIANLQGNLTGGTCVTNNPSDVMVRVGTICVDKFKASLWDSAAAGATQQASVPGTCNADGTDNGGACNIVAQSRDTASVTPIDGNAITWAQAQRACTNAGKRLLTPGEWMAAFSSGKASAAAGGDLDTVDKQEYVDAIALAGHTGTSTDDSTAGKLQVGYMGVTTADAGVNANSNDFKYDATATVANIFGFRCAR